jgi:hypothetical protein
MAAPRIFIDISDPSALGYYSSIDGTQSPGSLQFFHNDTLPREIQLIKRRPQLNAGFEAVDPTGGSLKVEIGTADAAGSPYVPTGAWAISTPAAGTATVTTAGSATQNAVFNVALGVDSIGGSFQLSFGRAQIYTATIPSNLAIKANGTIVCVDGTSLQSTYFDLPGASSALVRFWYNQAGAGVAPATPAGGTLSAITTTVAGDSAASVAALTSAAIEAHAAFTSTAVTGATITWVAAAAGVKTTTASAGTSGHTVATVSQGTNGRLDQLYFTVYDEDGSVAVWFDAASAGATGYPLGAAGARRQIRVVVAADDTATTVATAAATAIDADGKFNGTTSSAGTVTIGLTNLGELDAGSVTGMGGLAGATITTSTAGFATTAVLPWGVTVDELTAAFDDQFVFVETSPNSWRATANAKGVYSTVTLVETALIQSKYFTGTIDLTAAALTTYFATDTSAQSLPGTLEMQYIDSGGFKSTILHAPCSLVRDVIT